MFIKWSIKQNNNLVYFRHNEDGSYTYGYEGADGSFKIETKNPTGEVKGKYGYVDDTGKVRVVEYGATKYGFEPSGEGITVAPPTLVDESTDKNGLPVQYGEEPVQRPQQVHRPVQYKPAPVQYAQPAPQHSPAPVPQRIQVPGALSAGPSASFEFGTGGRSFASAPQAHTRPQLSLSAYASPAPIEEDTYEATPSPKITYAQPRPQPQAFQFASSPAATQAITRPQYTQYQPAPQPKYQSQTAPQQYQPAPQQYQPRPASPSGRVGGVLDQLAKDYALPSNAAAPLHDISFGYY